MLSRTLLGSATRLKVTSAIIPATFHRRHVHYKVPTRDLDFVLHEMHDITKHYKKIGFENVDKSVVDDIVSHFQKFAEDVLAPLNEVGDREGCKLDKQGFVHTPKGFKEAYAEYAAGGWQGMGVPEAYGGMNLPLSLGLIKSEMLGTANWAWGMNPGLTIGCINTLLQYGSEEQKKTYVTKLAEGVWSGTMCLTEPHCGTDLGQCKTKAVLNADGTYNVTGTKIFISCGDHDHTENIVHIVLARIEGAPAGNKGISLFLIPRNLNKADGSLETKKNVTCGGLEEKMGIHGSPTCVMNFDASKAWLIGAENSGIKQMFTFMNTARIGTALQGLGAMELAYQGSLPYASDRMSMRSLSGIKAPEKIADPIIVHGDVRKNLMTIKAFSEGARSMMYHTAALSDYLLLSSEQKEKADDELGLITPILKGFLTEIGTECANLGIQLWGGHGYIRANGMEQNVRDNRVSQLYEGTTGVQAMDLLGRKIILSKGKPLRNFASEVFNYCKESYQASANKKEALKLAWYTCKWLALTGKIVYSAKVNRDNIGVASVDYLMYSGYVMMGFHWLKMMDVAAAKLKANPHTDAEFYSSKVKTGQFYFSKLLPRADGLSSVITGGGKDTMNITVGELKAGRNF